VAVVQASRLLLFAVVQASRLLSGPQVRCLHHTKVANRQHNLPPETSNMFANPLTDSLLERILQRLPTLTIGVLGDLFLDRYLDLDTSLTEASLETGLDALQVVRVRSYPGAAGTVINNLTALGVGRVCPLSVIGDDGEGYELRQALRQQPAVDASGIVSTAERRTPTYTKPMLHARNQLPREWHRLDIKNRRPMPPDLERQVLAILDAWWPRLDALMVLDQVSEADCGVVTERVRARLAELGTAAPDRLILADSRDFIGAFRSIWLKPNQGECIRAVLGQVSATDAASCVLPLAQRTGRPVFCTCGERGTLVADPRVPSPTARLVPGFPVTGPIDIVGAGDSTSAGIVCAVAAGADLDQAAAFGNLVASITIQQLGTTGSASPGQVRQRWREVSVV
jgi:bifunctional ADP-heptose synthase (sugar kinase/adenylyltransferase)